MALDAEIFAIGGYSPRVRRFLEYTEDYYDGAAEGAPVFRAMYGAHFTSAVVELHACLAPQSGSFDPFKADLPRLQRFPDKYLCRGPDLEAFVALREARFSFYLTSSVPNLSQMQSEASSSTPGRIPLSACVVAFAPAAAEAPDGSLDSFWFEAASDPHVGDRFSRELANAIGFDPWDVNQHLIARIPARHKIARLERVLAEDEVLAWDFARRAGEFLDWMERVHSIGWKLLFLPARWRSK